MEYYSDVKRNDLLILSVSLKNPKNNMMNKGTKHKGVHSLLFYLYKALEQAKLIDYERNQDSGCLWQGA